MPESRHRDVKAYRHPALQIKVRDPVKLPSMALDTGIHAGMTVLAEVPCQSGFVKRPFRQLLGVQAYTKALSYTL